MKIKLLLLSLMLSHANVSIAEVASEELTLRRNDASAPSARLEFSTSSEMDFESVEGGFSLDRILLQAPFGGLINLNDCNSLAVGLRYRGTWLESDSLLGDTDLHDVRLSVTWFYQQRGSRWSWMTNIAPSLTSDFEQIGGDDFFLNWRVGARYIWSDRLAFVVGMGSNSSTSDAGVLPSIGFQWHATDDLYLELLGPRLMSTWQPSDDWLVRCGIWVAGGYWNVEEAGRSLDVKLTSFRAGVGLEHRIKERVWLTCWAGATFGNELEIETTGGRKVFREDADSGWFVNLGLRVAAW